MVTVLLFTSRPFESYSEASVLIDRAGLLERDFLEAVAETRRELCMREVWKYSFTLQRGSSLYSLGC